MTDSLVKENVLQIRISEAQSALIDDAFKHYLLDNQDCITRSEFLRQQIMLQCLKILKIVESK